MSASTVRRNSRSQTTRADTWPRVAVDTAADGSPCRTAPRQRDLSGLVLERSHHEPLVQFRVVEVLEAELQGLPERARISLAHVYVAEGQGETRVISWREFRQYAADSPVVHVLSWIAFQGFAADENGRS